VAAAAAAANKLATAARKKQDRIKPAYDPLAAPDTFDARIEAAAAQFRATKAAEDAVMADKAARAAAKFKRRINMRAHKTAVTAGHKNKTVVAKTAHRGSHTASALVRKPSRTVMKVSSTHRALTSVSEQGAPAPARVASRASLKAGLPRLAHPNNPARVQKQRRKHKGKTQVLHEHHHRHRHRHHDHEGAEGGGGGGGGGGDERKRKKKARQRHIKESTMAKIRENMKKRKRAAALKQAAAAQVAAERTTAAMVHAHERHTQAIARRVVSDHELLLTGEVVK